MATKTLIKEVEIISEDLLKDLRGGIADVLSEKTEKSKEGDGAKYVCCIEIHLPPGKKTS